MDTELRESFAAADRWKVMEDGEPTQSGVLGDGFSQWRPITAPMHRIVLPVFLSSSEVSLMWCVQVEVVESLT